MNRTTRAVTRTTGGHQRGTRNLARTLVLGALATAVVSSTLDLILVSPCGFTIDQSRADMPRLVAAIGWQRLRAVVDGRVCIADGNRYFHRPGPSLVESLEILAEIIHPDDFDFGHRGRDWVRWDG